MSLSVPDSFSASSPGTTTSPTVDIPATGPSRRALLRTAAGLAMATTGWQLFGHPSAAYADTPTPGASVTFGSTASETAASLTQVSTSVISGSYSTTARTLNAAGASLTFALDCDASAQNYLTVKLWGSDTGTASNLSIISIDGTALSPAYLYGNSVPELDAWRGTACYPGRFFYATALLPLSLTTGKSKITITLQCPGQTRVSRGIYRAVVHTDPYFVPAAAEIVGSDPGAGAALPSPDGLSQQAHTAAQVNLLIDTLTSWQLYGTAWDTQVANGAPASITGAMVVGGWPTPGTGWTSTDWKNAIARPAVTNGNNVAMNYVAILAEAYLNTWSTRYQSAEVIDRVLKALDFFCVAQAANGGFNDTAHTYAWIGAPSRGTASSPLEGFGDQQLGRAVVKLWSQLSPHLDVTIDPDDTASTAPVSRTVAYTALLKGLRGYVVGNRGHAPNQDQAQMKTMWWSNKALQLLSPADAWSTATAMPYIYTAVGLSPLSSAADQYWYSAKGMPLEPGGIASGGYAFEYGPSNIALISELAQLTGDSQIIAQAKKAVGAMSQFYYRWIDGGGYARLVDDPTVGWRNNSGSPVPSYGGGSLGSASLFLKHPAAVRQAYWYFKDGAPYAISRSAALSGGHTMDDTLGWTELLNNFTALTALGAGTPLPLEPGGADGAWADEQAGIIRVKRGSGTERLVVVLNYRHGVGTGGVPATATVNNIARLHHTTSQIDRVCTVAMTSPGGFRSLYTLAYGNYLIHMNASLGASYSTVVPTGTGSTTKNLITGRAYAPNSTFVVPPQSTMVWALT